MQFKMMHSKTTAFWCSAISVAFAMYIGTASAQESIRIGMLLPMSGGPFIPVGADVSDGFELAIQDSGGQVNGRKILILREDTNHKPDIAQAKAKKLVFDDKADFLVGPIGASELTALGSFANQTKTPLIIPNSGDNSVTGSRCTPWVLRTSFSNDQIVRNMSPWLLKNGYKRVAFIAFDYSAGREIIEGVKKPFVAAGGTVVSEQYAPFGPISDFGPYLTKIKDEKPDAVFAFIPGSPGVAFVKQYNEFGLKASIPLTVGGWVISPQNLPAIGDAAEGIVGILNYVPSIDNSENKSFRQKFESKFNRPVSEYAAQGYDTGKLIVAALQATGGKVNDKAAFIKAMHGANINGTRGPLRIDPKTNNIIQDIYIFKAEKLQGKMEFAILDRFRDVQDAPNGCNL